MAESVELPPGVTVFERGWLSSNNLLLRGRYNTAVIDTGYATHAEQTVALLQRALGESPLDHIVNTHLHSDHCGGNAALRANWPETRISIPAGEADVVARWDIEALSYEPTGQQCPRFLHDELLLPGTEIPLGGQLWQIHAAPGHDPEAVILFEPTSRTLVSGDALWENGFGVVFPELESEPGFDDVAATLDVIESLNPAIIVPGHGRPFSNASQALSTARDKLQRFVSNPKKHAHHAGKVLIKFKLLELQAVGYDALLAWARSTGYFVRIHTMHFSEIPLESWFEQFAAELAHSGALAFERHVDGSAFLANR